ncbi:MAG: cation:proton antiporter [Gemmatimonadales bacterium]
MAFSAETFVAAVALIGVVILVAALLSGVVDRTGIPQVAMFLILGVLLGPYGLKLIALNLDSPALRTISTLSLVLVLFSDSVTMDIAGLRRHARLAFTVLGPGTLVSAGLIALAAWGLLGLSVPLAAILGAALASTDPVMMRGVLRRDDVPVAARFALQVESGLNDVVVLPIVLIAMGFLHPAAGDGASGEVFRTLLDVFLLGPVAGAAVGLAAVGILAAVRTRVGMRRDYESLYVLGIAFTAYAAAEAVHGSGFMAAFAAGLTVAMVDVDMCECFHDFGQATAEMFLLFTFVAFGAYLIWTGLDVITLRVLGFAVVGLLGRSAVLFLVLRGGALDRAGRDLVVWYGPRALSSLLLVLVPYFAGVRESAVLFPIVALVVLFSVIFHGLLAVILTRRLTPAAGAAATVQPVPAPPVPPPGASPPDGLVHDPVLITFDELDRLRQSGQPVTLLDVRTDNAWLGSEVKARGAVRLPPDRPVDNAARLALPRQGWLVGYCA